MFCMEQNIDCGSLELLHSLTCVTAAHHSHHPPCSGQQMCGLRLSMLLQIEKIVAAAHHEQLEVDCLRAYHFGSRFMVEAEVSGAGQASDLCTFR